MALEDFRDDMETCCRCSYCKFIPLEKVKGHNYAYACPSIGRYNFNAYSGGGRLSIAMALLEGRVNYSKKLLEIVYNCQMCGACDISCKYAMDMEVLEPINEMRNRCVEQGQTLSALDDIIKNLRKNGTMISSGRKNRAQWAKGFQIKNVPRRKAEVLYHVGCRISFDRDMWKIARASVVLLQNSGIDFGIAGEHEICCGGRAYQMGYREDFLNQAKRNSKLFKNSGAKILVTGCSECYHAFKVLYNKYNMMPDFEVLHITEYLARLMEEGKMKPTKVVAAEVTYHDPCHLGRQGEPYIHWEGKRIEGNMIRFRPRKEFRRGTYGIYSPPRKLLGSIPGLKLIEMDRTKEYAWCCGSGGGVKETNPHFAKWTANERIEEAESTGADAIVTACPGCRQHFKEVARATSSNLKVYDVVELLQEAL
jgi:Fe-S oxidoreductase